MAVHESQSRLWENQIGRSRAFWHYWGPRYREHFPKALKEVSSEDLYKAIKSVSRNPIRVDSDEVTYNLHIILRFEIEKQLFAQKIKIQDLPDAWNQLTEELLCITPPNDAAGVLQDVHWSCGAFGYFPSYSLGNMIAAQLWYSLLKDMPDTEVQIARGQFQGILKWLRSKIHSLGKRLNTLELTQHATGQPLSPNHLVNYLKERYA